MHFKNTSTKIKNLFYNLHLPIVFSYMEHQQKPHLQIANIVEKGFLKKIPNLVTLKTFAKISYAMVFPYGSSVNTS
jgi:hypothetical protein